MVLRTSSFLAAAAALAALAAPTAASAKTTLPVTVRLASDDPTTLRDQRLITVQRSGNTPVTGLRVALTKGGKTYATAALPGTLGKRRTALPLSFARTPGKGTYRLVVSGRQSGARVTRTSTVTLTTGTLPVRAAPMSTLTGDNTGSVRLVLRSIAGQTVTHVRATLVDASGASVATATASKVAGQATVDLPLAGRLRAGTYTLELSGRASGTGTAATQPLVFAAGSTGPQPAGGSNPTTGTQPVGGLVRQRAVVDWSNGQYAGRENAGFVAPGIGYGVITCRPDAQWIRFYPNDQSRESTMMNWTYRDWGAGGEKALREALHTQGTGPDFQEGLNKFWPTEKTSTGEFDGIITDRGLIGGPGGGPFAAPTTLRLTWTWNMTNAGHESCHVEATFTTEASGTTAPLARSAQVVWRGDANAAGRTDASTDVPGLGTMTVTCQPGTGNREISFDTPQGATITTRQGSDDVAVPQSIGPVVAQLPNNGMLSIAFANGQTVLVSSRWKTNDPDPTQNWCAVSAQAVVG